MQHIAYLTKFFKGLEISPHLDPSGKPGPGAIELVKEILKTDFSPPKPVGFKTDYYSAPLQNPFCIFWKRLHDFGDKTVIIHTSHRTRKKVIVYLGDRVNVFVELFYQQLVNFILPFVLVSLILAATIYDNNFTDDYNPANQPNLIRLLFFFYPTHVVFWNLLSVLLTFGSVTGFIYSAHGRPQIRSGVVMSLQHLSHVSGFHFMISYNWDSRDLALSLASVIAQLPLNVWMDLYRLENAYRLQASASFLQLQAALHCTVNLTPPVCAPACPRS